MHDDSAKSFIEVSQALIYFRGSYLMQLRDFKDGIESPGHWGFFAGHIEAEETPEQTIWREIQEELGWQPENFRYIGELIAGSRKMHVFHCELEDEIETLSLMEGEEIGVFLPQEIEERHLYSKKRKSYFPITEISYGVFNKFGKYLT
tara:strand:- start:168 stop:611 length:444 start_codon:yes stop_codon:yes gene_type:complete